MKDGMIRYAVVGMGHIAQVAVLPAFKHAKKNSKLAAIVSGSVTKRSALGKKYGVPTYSYDKYDALMHSGEIDAVYIALPNQLHCDFTLRAARAGVHVLCEKPMAPTPAECRKMIETARASRVKLMVAYRLHFEEANMKAVEMARSGKLGPVRLFNSVFTMQVRKDNYRVNLDEGDGGGPLYDIGIYCINAARYLFQAEPYEVCAFQESRPDTRFEDVEEMISAVMRFPGNRLAAFTCSFGIPGTSFYHVIGGKGSLRLEPAYEYVGDLVHFLTLDGKTRKKVFSQKDQFAPQLLYFSDCILNHKKPEPSGEEGLADIRIIEALHHSAKEGRPVLLHPPRGRKQRPGENLVMTLPAVKKPETIGVHPASGGP